MLKALPKVAAVAAIAMAGTLATAGCGGTPSACGGTSGPGSPAPPGVSGVVCGKLYIPPSCVNLICSSDTAPEYDIDIQVSPRAAYYIIVPASTYNTVRYGQRFPDLTAP